MCFELLGFIRRKTVVYAICYVLHACKPYPSPRFINRRGMGSCKFSVALPAFFLDS